MATVSISRSDLFPVGTTVGIYPHGSRNPGNPPTAPAIASGTVAADGSLSVTDAGLLSYTTYVAAAQVGGVWNYARLRSTLDVSDTGRGLGTGNTTSGSASLTSVSATSGAFAVGQRITGPGIPPGTFLIDNPGGGSTWTMSDKATATATGVALEAYGASPPVVPSNAGSGALAVPVATTKWRPRVGQRRWLVGGTTF